MKNYLYTSIFLLSFQLSFAQSDSKIIEMTAANWDAPADASFEIFDGRQTLVLNSGRATVKNQDFTNGTIEVDVFANSMRSFAGITFRKQNDDMEEVYMRMHKSEQVDAVQYTPIFNNESNWQLYHQYQAKTAFKTEGWNTLRLEVQNNRADVFINDKKVMNIDHLRTENERGEIGLFALFSNRFSNFKITHKKSGELSPIESSNKTDTTIITEWQITEARPYNQDETNLNNMLQRQYKSVTTEKSGLLTISKYLKKTSSGNFEGNSEDYTIAYKSIYADSAGIKAFTFDYSDKIIVFFNGKAIYNGNNAFRSKGIQYKGHIDINSNKLYLPVKQGENHLHCVVIDKANGWGLIAKLE